jgi:hypothetical protein
MPLCHYDTTFILNIWAIKLDKIFQLYIDFFGNDQKTNNFATKHFYFSGLKTMESTIFVFGK